MTFDASLAGMTAEEFVADGPRRDGSTPRPSSSAGTSISARAAPGRRPFLPMRAAAMVSPSRSSARSRWATGTPRASCRRRRSVGRWSAATSSRRRRGLGRRYVGVRAGHSGTAARAHAWRADRKHRARADQPAGARGLCGPRRGRRTIATPPSRASASGRPWTMGRRCSKCTFWISHGDLYGREMAVEFVERIRDERKFEFARGAGRGDASRRGARARDPGAKRPERRIWRFQANPLIPRRLSRRYLILASQFHDRRARKKLRLFADALSAEDGLSDAGGTAAKGAGNSCALGARRPLRPASPRAARAGRNSCCTTDRPTPTATSISGTR